MTDSQAFFSPGEACRSHIVQLLNQAKRRVDICVFTITDNRVAGPLLSAHHRGVKIRIITDNFKAEDRGSDIDRLYDAGIHVRTDRSQYHMHHKYALFDERLLITGSYNWTRTAATTTAKISSSSEMRTSFKRSKKTLTACGKPSSSATARAVMSVHVLSDDIAFPDPAHATEDGLVAIGGDLSPERLLCAYRSGIFPWPTPSYPLLWFSPSPRYAFVPTEIHVPKRLQRLMRQNAFEVRMDTAFAQVIERCAQTKRPDQNGTWITDEMLEAYTALHRLGYAHSVEAWRGDKLVGGVYGVALGGGFAGESMFADEDNASKVAFVTLSAQLQRWGFTLIDCQVHTEHLERFGARAFNRRKFLTQWQDAVSRPTKIGPWQIEITPAEAVGLTERFPLR